jgi:hypothetical protein
VPGYLSKARQEESGHGGYFLPTSPVPVLLLPKILRRARRAGSAGTQGRNKRKENKMNLVALAKLFVLGYGIGVVAALAAPTALDWVLCIFRQ